MLLPSVDKQVFMQKQWNWKWIVYLNANQTNFDLRCFAEWLVSKMWSLSKAWKWDFTFFHVQDCNLKLFQNKCFRNVVKSFYTASLLYDVLTQFGELSEEVCDASFLWVTLKSKIINHDFNILGLPPTFVDIWIYIQYHHRFGMTPSLTLVTHLILVVVPV